MKHLMAAATAVVVLAVCASAARTLDIYFIDVEGGQSTLVVTSAGQSLLIDAGYPDWAAATPAASWQRSTTLTWSESITS